LFASVGHRQISRLLDDGVFDGTGGTGHRHETGESWIAGRNARHQHGAERVAKDEHAPGIDSFVRAQRLDGFQRVIDGFLLDGEVRHRGKTRRIDFRSLVIPQNGDAPRREAEREIPERLGRADRFVTVAGPRPVYQHDGRKRSRALGDIERGR
jgi:hypothetical protein